jgi:hypothetical protein
LRQSIFVQAREKEQLRVPGTDTTNHYTPSPIFAQSSGRAMAGNAFEESYHHHHPSSNTMSESKSYSHINAFRQSLNNAETATLHALFATQNKDE